MGKLMMLAGGIVEPDGAKPGAVSAYVVLSAGHTSRIFKINGKADAPGVEELGAATTVDMKRFQNALQKDLEPSLDERRKASKPAIIGRPSDTWVCGLVRAHLKKSEGLDVG